MMILFIAAIVFLMGMTIKQRLDRSIFNDYLIVIGPYVVILLINNMFMVQHFSFYEISRDAQIAILIAETAYLSGSIGGSLLTNRYINTYHRMQVQQEETLFLHFGGACLYTVFACMTVAVHICTQILRLGLSNVTQNDFEALKLSGISGHLFISVYALVPIIFYEAVQRKSWIGFGTCALAMLCAFSTFVKYNVILMLLIIGLYYVIRKPEAMKKAILLLAGGIVLLFAGNYAMLFLTQAADTNNMLRFLISHLWMYISSGTMMMNYTIGNIGVHYTVLDFFIQSFGAVPNMFLSVVSNFQFQTVHSFSSVLDGMQRMSSTGEMSNALSVLAMLYSDGGNIPSFSIIMAVWGCVTSVAMQWTKLHCTHRVETVGVIFLAYSMLSFFGNYWELTMPWEMLVYALLFSVLFDKKRGVIIQW